MDSEEYRNAFEWPTEILYGENAPVTGIFATRTEYRPNPIALTTYGILEGNKKKGIVKVGGTDAFDGTPVIDLIAYFPICDHVIIK